MAGITDLPSRTFAPTANTILTGLSGGVESAREPSGWVYVPNRFQCFLSNIEPTNNQHEDIFTKARGIIGCLSRHYWGGPLTWPSINAVSAGSWDKGTRVRTVSDLDLIFLLPWTVYWRFESRQGNKQSDLLQEVKNVLTLSYPNTDIKCDGPTIIMDFSTYKVEIAPGFIDFSSPTYINDPSFLVKLCDTNAGGRYKQAAPAAERSQLTRYNTAWNGDLIALVRMAKIWKKNCNVPIKSFYLEQLGIAFLAQWNHAGKGVLWYDWMIRDFFQFMFSRQNSFGILPVSNELFFYGDRWASRAETAWKNSCRACIYEQLNHNEWAGEEWQKIFSTNIPKSA